MALPTSRITGQLATPSGSVAGSAKVTATLSATGSAVDPSTGLAVPIVGSTQTSISASGAFSIDLVPNDIISPSGTYYSIIFSFVMGDGNTYESIDRWFVPSGSGRTLGDVSRGPGGSISVVPGPAGVPGVPGSTGPQGPPGTPSTPSNWYVDSLSGNDSNSGQAPDQPLLTISALLSKSIATGATINLARGSHWREMLTGLPIGTTVRAYDSGTNATGSGARPMLDCSDVATNANFSKTGGYTSVYQITWQLDSTEFVASNANYRVWENSVRLVRATSLANCDATAGSFYAPLTPSAGGDAVYVHGSASDNPAANGKTYELAKRMWGLNGGQYYPDVVRIESIHTKRNAGGSGSLLSSGTAVDCVAEDGIKHNMWNNGTADRCVAWGNEPSPNIGGHTMFISFWGLGGRGATYRKCWAISDDAVNASGFYTHTNAGSYRIDRLIFEDCVAIGCYGGFAGSNVKIATVQNCRTYKCPVAVSADIASDELDITGGTFIAGSGVGMRLVDGHNGAPALTRVRGVRAIGSAAGGYAIWFTYGTTLQVSRSTFIYPAMVFQFDAPSLSLDWRSTIVEGPVTFIVAPGGSGVTYTADNNVWHQSAGSPSLRLNGSTYTSLAAWKTATGQEANSVSTDPSFIGSSAVGDCHISATSPAWAIMAGADVEPDGLERTALDYFYSGSSAP